MDRVAQGPPEIGRIKVLQGGRKSRKLSRVDLNQHGRILKTEILSTHTAELFQAAVRRAAELLRAGEVVALPTETVYGLAANALDADAVSRIYEVKGRPAHNPIIVHVAGVEMAKRCAADWPESAVKLARAFWPGPLTLVLRRSHSIPEVVTAGGETVGLRWPSHPFIQAVIRECGFPLAAPSANRSNGISPTNAAHVSKDLEGRIRLIVDGGQSQVGIESTVLDLSGTKARVLRPGIIHGTALEATMECGVGSATCGVLADGHQSGGSGVLKSPGQLPKHYSPRAKLEILSWKTAEELERRVGKGARVHVIAHTVVPMSGAFARVSVIPHDAEAFARAIYAELHACDDAGAERIIVEALPETSEWEAIADRLKRAAA
jgi:L-threonylcarbamoyladenylate synthase